MHSGCDSAKPQLPTGSRALSVLASPNSGADDSAGVDAILKRPASHDNAVPKFSMAFDRQVIAEAVAPRRRAGHVAVAEILQAEFLSERAQCEGIIAETLCEQIGREIKVLCEQLLTAKSVGCNDLHLTCPVEHGYVLQQV